MTTPVRFHKGGVVIAGGVLSARPPSGTIMALSTLSVPNVVTQTGTSLSRPFSSLLEYLARQPERPSSGQLPVFDTSLLFEDDGRIYIQGSWRPNGIHELIWRIRQVEIDMDMRELLSELRVVRQGFARKTDVERPRLYETLLLHSHCWGWYIWAVPHCNRPLNGYMGPDEPTTGISFSWRTRKTNLHGIQDVAISFGDASGRWWAVCLGIWNIHEHYPIRRETPSSNGIAY